MVKRFPVDGIPSGQYTGDGESSQDIICNFPPSRVKIFDEDGNFAELGFNAEHRAQGCLGILKHHHDLAATYPLHGLG